MTPSEQQRVEMSRILHLLAKLPLLCRIFQALRSLLLWSLLPTQRRFCREGLALLLLLLLSDRFFSLHLCMLVPGAVPQLPRGGEGFIFLLIWLRSLPALSHVISGARLCLWQRPHKHRTLAHLKVSIFHCFKRNCNKHALHLALHPI